MPDSKITALTSISTSTDPANDPLVIVDVSDTSMAATGTTKKVTLNNLLACSPTATLASATITGAASAAGLSVTGSTIPTNGVYLPSANNLGFAYNSTLGMTLNSTGLGVGVSPSYKFQVRTTSDGACQFIGRSGGTTNPNFQVLFTDATATTTINAGSGAGNPILTLATAGTDRLIIDSSGNVGIGVTPSVSKLHVGITSTATSGLAEANALKIENNNATVNNAAGLFLSQTGDAGCGIAGIATSRTGGSRTSALALYYYNQATSASPIEGARLDASGNLLVGLTNTTGANYASKFFLSADSGTTKWCVGPYAIATNFIIAAAASGGVYLNGTAATSWTSASDERLKDIIEPISNAVSKVASLRAVIGKFKSDENNTRKPFIIAQDVQAVLPEAVDASNPDKLGVAYSDVIPLLVAAIKELSARVQTLEAK